jgi:hypothetical protein
MARIREIVASAARDVAKVVVDTGAFDPGRLIAAIDRLQEANTACDALLLPHVSKPAQ